MPIRASLADQVALVTIDRQDRRNALDLRALEELHAAVVDALDRGARVLILTGAGDHFCAGADLTELRDVSFTKRLAEVLQHLAAVPAITLAVIEGSCMGLGMQLAMACDLRVVSETARFGVPVGKLGLMVDHWTLNRLSRYWGEGAARQLVLTAAVLDAKDAWRLGFTQVRGGLDDALNVAYRTAPLAPLTLTGSKLGLETSPDDAEGLRTYEEAFGRAWASTDLAEGRMAFSQNRPPRFRGR